MDIGLLIARLFIGLAMAAHGSQKLFGAFGGYGLAGTGGFFASLGFRPGVLFATLAGLGEFGGGLLLAVGLLGPIGPAVIISVMIVAAMSVHRPNGFFAMSNGIELPALYIATMLPFALVGFGRYSVDAIVGGGAFWTVGRIWIVIAIGVAGGLGSLALRGRPAPSAS